mgnify:FL=1
MGSFDLEEKRLKKEIVKRKAKKVLLQLPEGLKPEATKLAKVIEEAGAMPIILAEPCYGACDIALEEAKALKADLIVHYGHSPLIIQDEVPTLYFPAKAKTRVISTVRKALPLLEDYSKIGLVTTIQHIHVLEKVRKALLDAGKAVVIGDASKTAHPGQVVGCDFSNAQAIAEEVEAFLFFGGGRFHAIGAALSTGKPVVIADPYLRQAYRLEDEVNRILRRRWASIDEARKAETFGVLIGLKVGQKRFKKALEIKKKLEEAGRKAFLIALREITPERLMQFPSVDAYVNTACPRLSLDDAPKFRKPLLTPRELQVMLGELSWEEVCRKGWFENEI